MSSDQQPVDPQAVEETKQQIRGLVEEITRLTKRDVAPTVFYGEFLQRVVSALAAIGGAVWTQSEEGPLRLMYQINLRESLPEEQGEDHVRHARLLHHVLNTGEESLVPPYSGAEGEEGAGNPTAYLLVLVPIRTEGRVVGVVEVLQRPTSGPASQRGYLRFLTQMSALVGEYLKGRRLRQLTDQQSLFSKADRFAKTVHDSLEPRTTAYTIANEGRRLIGCDRVSVAIKRGNRCRIEAVSGQDTMDARANTVTLLGKLATAVVRNGEPLWYTGPTDELPPQIEDAVHEYVDECHSKSVAVLPLCKPRPPEHDAEDRDSAAHDDPEPVAALIIEQIEDSRPPESYSETVDLVTEHSSRALANALEHNNLFLMPVWRAIGNTRWVLQGRTLPKTIAIALTVLTALLFICLARIDFNLKGKGTLQPSVRREVFVDVDGNNTVMDVLVSQGQSVDVGDILVVMRNPGLEISIDEAIGGLEKTIESLNSSHKLRGVAMPPADRVKIEGQIRQDLQAKETWEKMLALLNEKKDRLTVRSPIKGQVVTSWTELETLRERPVTIGSRLMTIVDPESEWELEVDMPEDKMGHISKFQSTLTEGEPLSVTYVLANEPEKVHEGTVIEIGKAAQLNEENENTVPIKVHVDQADLADRRVGIEATAKVKCGRRAIAYVWFYQLIEFVQSRILF